MRLDLLLKGCVMKIKAAPTAITRRQFLVVSGGLGLTLGFGTISGCVENRSADENPGIREKLNHYIEISSDGFIRLYSPNPEMGQGTKTSLAMILAEEMDANWQDVMVENSPVDVAIYGRQKAGGSMAIKTRWNELRKMGAAARHMLRLSAAEHWGAAVQDVRMENSFATQISTGKKISYADLVEYVSEIEAPDLDSLMLKSRDSYQIIGSRVGQADATRIAQGEPIFGIDLKVPDMLYANLVKSTRLGGRPNSANLDEIKLLPGIYDAFIVEGATDIVSFAPASTLYPSGIAIAGESTWAVFQAKKKLIVDWNFENASKDDSELIKKQAAELSGKVPQSLLFEKGNVQEAAQSSDFNLSAYYSIPWISHAQLEPCGAIVSVKDDRAEAWVSSQTLNDAQKGLSDLLGIPQSQIVLHQVRGGGAFGRRLENDSMREAAVISRKVGRPIKVQWSREDDMAFDYFRAPGFFKLSASFNKDGEVTSWVDHLMSISADGSKPSAGADLRVKSPQCAGQSLAHYQYASSLISSVTPTGYMRAPRSNTYAFAEQSFVHEIAMKLEQDHAQFLMKFLAQSPNPSSEDPKGINSVRAIAVIQDVLARSNWNDQTDRWLGLAFYFSHASYAAEVVDLEVDEAKKVKVNNVWVSVDIGHTVINPGFAEAQCKGAVIEGLGVLAAQEIKIREGAVTQTNFHEYPLLKMPAAPNIEVSFVRSDYDPSGVGEPALPPIAPAVCNAIFAATGERIRHLPLLNSGYELV